jgi:hypothetical protein
MSSALRLPSVLPSAPSTYSALLSLLHGVSLLSLPPLYIIIPYVVFFLFTFSLSSPFLLLRLFLLPCLFVFLVLLFFLCSPLFILISCLLLLFFPNFFFTLYLCNTFVQYVLA